MYYKENSKTIGEKGEKAAEKYLRKRGYLFIARNYWSEHGEIDLIFWKFFKLVFVEVKTRSTTEYGTGREAVDYAKIKSLKYTARSFVKSHCSKNKAPFYLRKLLFRLKFFKTRFDVIEVFAKDKSREYEIKTHLKGYFDN